LSLQAGTTGFIRHSRCSENAIGVELTASPKFQIQSCEFSCNKCAGLALADVSPEIIRDCSFTDKRDCGIDPLGSTCVTTFVNCIVIGNKIGISLNLGSNASFIGGNVGGKQVAVNVDGGHFTGKSVTIRGTRAAGVSAFAGAEVTLDNCSIQQNDNYGIQVFNGGTVKAIQYFVSSSVDTNCDQELGNELFPWFAAVYQSLTSLVPCSSPGSSWR
jgi:hypothetical protein